MTTYSFSHIGHNNTTNSVTGLYHPPGIIIGCSFHDAEKSLSSLIKSARRRVAIVDDIIDDSILCYLEDLNENIDSTIYTNCENLILRHDVSYHNSRHHGVGLKFYNKNSDNYLIIDDKVYKSEVSFNRLGNKQIYLLHDDTVNADKFLDHLVFY